MPRCQGPRILLACGFATPGLFCLLQDVPTTSHLSRREGEKARDGPGLSFKDMIWKLHTPHFCSHLIGRISYMATPSYKWGWKMHASFLVAMCLAINYIYIKLYVYIWKWEQIWGAIGSLVEFITHLFIINVYKYILCGKDCARGQTPHFRLLMV